MWKTGIVIVACGLGAVFSVVGWPKFERPRQGAGIIMTVQNSAYRRVLHIGASPVESLVRAQLAVAPRSTCSGGVNRSRWKSGVMVIVTPIGATGPIDGQPLDQGSSELQPAPPRPLVGGTASAVPTSAIKSQRFSIYASQRYAENGRLKCPSTQAMTHYSLSSGWNVVQADTKDTPEQRYAVVQGSAPHERSITLALRPPR